MRFSIPNKEVWGSTVIIDILTAMLIDDAHSFQKLLTLKDVFLLAVINDIVEVGFEHVEIWIRKFLAMNLNNWYAILVHTLWLLLVEALWLPSSRQGILMHIILLLANMHLLLPSELLIPVNFVIE